MAPKAVLSTWDASKVCHLDRRRSRSGETPVFRSLCSHPPWNESETPMAVPCSRTCFSCCHPRRESAVLSVRYTHPGMAPKAVLSTWDASKVCHLDRRRSRSGETPVFRSLDSHTFWNESETNMAVPAAGPAFLVVIPEGDLRFQPRGYTHPGIALRAEVSFGAASGTCPNVPYSDTWPVSGQNPIRTLRPCYGRRPVPWAAWIHAQLHR